ncbi:MAG: hypothetical protein JJU36_03660 [Phycisphaeraceae bacterium]|nr:hypothetical protein [Phycisphaeraceae bacterium]
MATSFGALCNDFFINQQILLKMDLPSERDTLLHLFDRVRRSYPMIDRLRRFDDELLVESNRKVADYKCLSLRRTSIRTGHINPVSMEEAYQYHRMVLEVAPYHLSISPLDVDYLELTYGFELECKGNQDEVIHDALLAHSPLGALLGPFHSDGPRSETKLVNVQPAFGVQLSRAGDLQGYFEVKTRHRGRRGQSGRSKHEPICIMLTVRRYGPVHELNELDGEFCRVRDLTERLVAERLVPELLTPVARCITSGA